MDQIENPIELLSNAFKLFWERIATLLPISFIVFAVGLLQVFSMQLGSRPLAVLTALAGILVGYVSYLAMMRAISSPVHLNVWEAYISIERLIVPAAWVSALLVLVVVGGLLLAIVPGIIVAVYGLFAIFAVVLDNYQGRDALIFSWHLVRNRWWAVVLRFVAANFIIAFIVGIVMAFFWALGIGEGPAETMIRFQERDYDKLLSQVIVTQVVNNFFTTPITLCFMYVLYEALKRRTVAVVTEEEKKDARWYIRTLSIIGLAFLIACIFISSVIIVKFLPQVVGAVHLPAAAFSAF